MKRLGLGLMLAFLAGCGLFGSTDEQSGAGFFRDIDVPLASTTRFDPVEFSGFWHMRAKFAPEGDEVLRGGVDFRTGRDGNIAQVAIHGEKRGGRLGLEEVYDVAQVAPGRFTFGTLPYATEYWVLWADADYRTAVIGTPSGSFGWIIDRKPNGGADRITAGREILDWMGYDMARLVVLP